MRDNSLEYTHRTYVDSVWSEEKTSNPPNDCEWMTEWEEIGKVKKCCFII